MIDYVKTEHLIFWIDKLQLQAPAKEKLKKAARSKFPARRAEVYKAIEAEHPGKPDELQEIWSYKGGRAIGLWHAPALKGKLSPAKMKEQLDAALQRMGERAEFSAGWNRIKVRRGRKKDPRVHRVRIINNELQASVRLVKEMHWQDEDHIQEGQRTPDVDIRIPLKGDKSLVRVFAGYNDGRRALITFFGWLLAENLPEDTEGLADYFDGFTFAQSDAENIALKQDMKVWHMEGDDSVAADKVGEIAIGRIVHDGIPVPLDLTDERVAPQVGTPKHHLVYIWKYKHSDGFVETVRIAYVFKARPHISFPVRASRPAMEQAIDDLRAEVGPRA